MTEADSSIARTRAALLANEVSCAELVERCLERIADTDRHVQAWSYLAPEAARREGRRLDERRLAGADPGPLAGVLVGVKDVVDVEGMPTGCGFGPWTNRIATQNAWLVACLCSAGAVVPGKTVTTQFAAFDPPPTRNPWNPERTPGGSSSGSAVAVAVGACPAAIGTQTGGSVLRPAAYCGVVGIKPTYGTVSRRGVFPFAASLDHIGVFARTVYDAAVVLNAIATRDPLRPKEGRPLRADLTEWPPRSRRPLRVGVVEAFYRNRCTDEAWDTVATSVRWLEEGPATVEPVASLREDEFTDILTHHRVLMTAEAAYVHRKLYSARQADYAPAIASVIEEGLKTSALRYQEALAAQRRYRRHIRRQFDRFDVLLTPATASTAPDRSTTGDPAFQSPWSFLGFPAVAVPVTMGADGLPLAVQIVAGWRQEAVLLEAAHRIELGRGRFPAPPL